MKTEDREQIKRAWKMLLDAVNPYGGVLEIVEVKMQNGIHRDEPHLFVGVVARAGQPREIAFHHLEQLQDELRKTAFQFYTTMRVLVTPHVEFAVDPPDMMQASPSQLVVEDAQGPELVGEQGAEIISLFEEPVEEAA